MEIATAMKILEDVSGYDGGKSIITLGKFDGLHRGHSKLFQEMHNKKQMCASSIHTVAVTFDRAPGNLLLENRQEYIFSKAEKYLIYEKEKTDYVLEIPLTKEFLSQEPEDFVKNYLVKGLHAAHIIVGSDFRFGKDRGGDVKLLQRMGAEFGFSLQVEEKVEYDGREVSSTFIREEIRRGNLNHVNEMLGYPYFLLGEVIHGNAFGRTIGVPTINMLIPQGKVMFPNGVFATGVMIEDKLYRGMTNVGVKPSVGKGNPLSAETFILNFSGDLYGKICKVEFYEFLRKEKKFNSIEELKEQIAKDVQTASGEDKWC